MTCLPLLLAGLIGAVCPRQTEQVIDQFRFTDPQVAVQTWVASSGTPPVELITDGGRTVLKVVAPFATDPKLPRTVIDRELNLDLAAPGEFSLKVASDSPDGFTQLTLYFRSSVERLALAELISHKIPKLHAGPDVWEPARRDYRKAVARDGLHPS